MINLKNSKIYKHRKYFLWQYIKNNYKVLDIGNLGFLRNKIHGNSFYNETISKFKNVEFFGIDIESMGKEISDFPNQIQHNVNEGIPFENDFFDVIYMGQVLEHLENANFVLKEINRALKLNGTLVIDVPNPYSIDRILKYLIKRIEDLGEESHLVFYTPGSLSRLLKFNSFIIDEMATDWSLVSLKYKFIPKIARSGFGSHILISAKAA